jgi:hypothetical protein
MSGSFFPCQPVRNQFKPQPLISHLTNSNGCGNIQSKVLLTVSPFRPSLCSQPRVYPQPFDFVCPLFSSTCELPLPTERSARPLFSDTYELLFRQILYFDSDLRCPIVFWLHRIGGSFRPHRPSICMPFVFLLLQIPFSSTRLFSHLYKTPGWRGNASGRCALLN